jgi:hypothetical protein
VKAECEHDHCDRHIYLGNCWAYAGAVEPDRLICRFCLEWLPLGVSSDDIPGDEMALAELLAEIPSLWEPKDQARAIADAVESCR